MKARQVILIVVVLVAVALLLALAYRFLRPGTRDLSGAIDQALAAAQATTAVSMPRPTPTPGLEALAILLEHPEYNLRLSTALGLPAREDLSPGDRAELLATALASEIDSPSTAEPPVPESYLDPSGVLRLAILRSLAALGPDALAPLREAAEGADGAAREHLLIALVQLGDNEALPEVRTLVLDSEDPVVRMAAARSLAAGTAEAARAESIIVLTAALEDPYRVAASDSLGEYTIHPVREQAAWALEALGVALERDGDTFTVEGY